MAKRYHSAPKIQNLAKSDFEVYTDGGYSMAHDRGGYAYIILKDGEIWKKAAFPIEHETNNRGELKAILTAVRELPENSSADICSDSRYALGVLGKEMWSPKKNLDIIDDFNYIIQKNNIKVRFIWVRGHSGNQWNEMCDRMCDEVAGMDLNAEYVKKEKPMEKHRKPLRKYDDQELIGLYYAVVRELRNRGVCAGENDKD